MYFMRRPPPSGKAWNRRLAHEGQGPFGFVRIEPGEGVADMHEHVVADPHVLHQGDRDDLGDAAQA
jgi:hypothetical protein